jgi:alpha/beta superfamily hydrolase
MPATQSIGIPSGPLTLEGALTWPDGPALAAAAICHPHPLYGGDMHNNVVMSLQRALLRRGAAALRFNFRGAGRSGGEFAEGEGERADARAALAYLRAQPGLGDLPIGLAGFSFGGGVALAAAAEESDLAFLLLVAPAARRPIPGMETVRTPKLVLGGSRDTAVPPEAVGALFDRLAEPKQLEIVEHADHFWFSGKWMGRLEQIVEDWLAAQGF